MIWGGYDESFGRLDAAQMRGFDPDSVQHDRAPVEVTAEMRALVGAALMNVRHRRQDDLMDDHCGERCQGDCGERMCAVYGPEPRACTTTCVDCDCSCDTCLMVREEMRAELMHQIQKENSDGAA